MSGSETSCACWEIASSWLLLACLSWFFWTDVRFSYWLDHYWNLVMLKAHQNQSCNTPQPLFMICNQAVIRPGSTVNTSQVFISLQPPQIVFLIRAIKYRRPIEGSGETSRADYALLHVCWITRQRNGLGVDEVILSFSDSTLRTIITSSVLCVLRMEGHFLPHVVCFISMMKLPFNQSENKAWCFVFLVESDSVYTLLAIKRGRKCSRFWRVNGAKTS